MSIYFTNAEILFNKIQQKRDLESLEGFKTSEEIQAERAQQAPNFQWCSSVAAYVPFDDFKRQVQYEKEILILKGMFKKFKEELDIEN